MAETPISAAQAIVRRLGGTWHGAYGKVRCPAHADKRPSLSITPGDTRVLYKCFAGCTTEEIIAALRSERVLVEPNQRDDAVRPERKDLAPLCRELWGRALPLAGTPGEAYLRRRGIGHSTIGRYEPAAVTYDNDRRIRLPALYLPITEGRDLVALARIFIDKDGRKHPRLAEPKRTLGNPGHGCVKIGAIENNHLNLAEGFEDAESVIALHGLPGCWSVNGVELYAHLAIPAHICTITIYTQHGNAAKNGIAKGEGNLTAGGRSLDIVAPPPGGDWNDAMLTAQ
ncbi:hypothetical protein FHS51_003903 [Sphingobium wenxiniae]|jgi:putative DNA primase/helicase|uniref:DUF7146 domain-containing protein n=1 Tax=Sphingobium wenxiniae (strain DSM 21828 / CGMCC 1.7748 / JZ-1) TaxID=595605 RepID=UPI00161C471E|nr:hypothetical protein [Sphingobium wenxiniae]MBB6193645.1 hypothetical protein [Sphingobium wenxiniae]MBE5074923.1 hypothetical protein [Erythrobacteraceae bacterium E2-1 Yellow Sea]